MPVAAIIEHGTKPDFDLVDETGIMVKKVSFKPQRDFVERKNSDRWISYVRGENPRMDINISGTLVPDGSGEAQGLGDEHPGNGVAIANFTGTASVHGYDAADDAVIVMKDATRDLSEEEEPQVDVNLTLYPGITSP